MKEEPIMTYCSVLSRRSPRVAEENHKNINQGSRYQSELNHSYPDSESCALSP
jgi:hypothetical protein